MSENLMNSDHKATTDKYREGYEAIEWEEHTLTREEKEKRWELIIEDWNKAWE